jgi:hypothetical protein
MVGNVIGVVKADTTELVAVNTAVWTVWPEPTFIEAV